MTHPPHATIEREAVGRLLGIPFSEQQLDAICAPLEPGVVIAGAGSGKTTVMAARVVWLVASGQVRPEQVLGLTFTRKAAAELSQRVRAALGRAGFRDLSGIDETGEQVVMTYDAFAARLVAEHGLRIGVEREPTMITDATRFRLAARVVTNAAGPFESLARLRPRSITQRVLQLDSQLTSHLVGTDALDSHSREHDLAWAQAPTKRDGRPYVAITAARATLAERLELASLVDAYQELKRRVGVVEFADQMAVAARLAREVPQVAEAARDTYRVVLLDEYQDTSSAQAQLLQYLFSGPDVEQGRGHPVTAVGDPYQAIYGWRGAAASNIGQFAADFPRADGSRATEFPLTVNRRSGQAILDVANDLATNLHADQRSREAPVNLLEAPDATPRGSVRAATFDSWPEELAWLADDIIAQHDHAGVRWQEIAVLTRRNSDLARVYAELADRDVPAEIVGLGGLLELPEVHDVVSTLRLIDDVTANPDLIRLLTGPRWRIGPRDLDLLGQRARRLARERRGDEPDDSLLAALEEAVADVDPTEVVSLLDAVSDPGDLPYSPEARERFAQFAAELDRLREHAAEPVLDLVRRVITTIGVDIEVAATVAFEKTGRRTQLGVFCDAVAGYVDVDGDASLAGLLAWLRAEVEEASGLERATPTEQDSVKLLTVHRAKGLEWDHVYLPALVERVFPTDRVTDNWVTSAAVVPADLRGDAEAIPQLAEAENGAIKQYAADLKAQQLLSEDRLAYVAVTRARTHLTASAHHWRLGERRSRTPSAYFDAVAAEAREQDQLGPIVEPPSRGDVNPLESEAVAVPWPVVADPEAERRRRAAAEAVCRARRRAQQTGHHEASDAEPLLLDAAGLVADWDADAEQLIAEALRSRRGAGPVTMPTTMSVTDVLNARRDPEAYLAALQRPMPRPPASRARLGTRFHQWVEQHYASLGLATPPLVDLEDVEGRGDEVTADEQDLLELSRRFTAGRYGHRRPLVLEQPFTLMLAGQLVRGRIDAVFAGDGTTSHRYQVVDWKTGARDHTDPGQLAMYRIAWAELHDIDPEEVDAVFHHITTNRTERPDLPSRAELERLVASWPLGPEGDLA